MSEQPFQDAEAQRALDRLCSAVATNDKAAALQEVARWVEEGHITTGQREKLCNALRYYGAAQDKPPEEGEQPPHAFIVYDAKTGSCGWGVQGNFPADKLVAALEALKSEVVLTILSNRKQARAPKIVIPPGPLRL